MMGLTTYQLVKDFFRQKYQQQQHDMVNLPFLKGWKTPDGATTTNQMSAKVHLTSIVVPGKNTMLWRYNYRGTPEN